MSRVLIGCPLPAEGVSALRDRFEVEMVQGGTAIAWLMEHAAGAEAIVADPGIPVSAALLDAAGDTLKVVANFGVGFDNLDLEALRARGVRATNTPDVLTDATAELAVALMLAAGRRLTESDAAVRREGRAGDVADDLWGRELVGATVGLVGFGRIGRRVADLLGGFDARIQYASRSEVGGARARRCELNELLATSDFISLHLPLTPATRHLIDAAALARVRPGAILVNTSRGAIVDTGALVEALRSGHLAAAALDVYEDEPDVPAGLRELSNTVLTPHIGSATPATRAAMARLCAENVIAVMDGHEPPSPVI